MVASDQPLYVLLTNLPKNQMFIPDHKIRAHTVGRAQLDAPAEVTQLEAEPNTVSAVRYEPSIYTQMSRHQAVEQHDDGKLQHNRKDEIQLSEK